MLDQLLASLEAYVSLDTTETRPSAPTSIESGPSEVHADPPKEGA